MRCEIVASLLHSPRLLFLDEPTIGLDVTAKAAIRDLLRTESERERVTLILTSHDTGDIERVCTRVIVINHGRLLWDGPVTELRSAVSWNRALEDAPLDEVIRALYAQGARRRCRS
jgi:ABC-2 type transport system ATP-binding protein